jgi:hypothetical protein
MPMTRVNDIDVNYKLEGDGPETIVCVNGLVPGEPRRGGRGGQDRASRAHSRWPPSLTGPRNASPGHPRRGRPEHRWFRASMSLQTSSRRPRPSWRASACGGFCCGSGCAAGARVPVLRRRTAAGPRRPGSPRPRWFRRWRHWPVPRRRVPAPGCPAPWRPAAGAALSRAKAAAGAALNRAKAAAVTAASMTDLVAGRGSRRMLPLQVIAPATGLACASAITWLLAGAPGPVATVARLQAPDA